MERNGQKQKENNRNRQKWTELGRAGNGRIYQVSHVMCHVSHVTCHVSRVSGRVSPVTNTKDNSHRRFHCKLPYYAEKAGS